MNQKGQVVILILVGVLVVLIAAFIPIPYYQSYDVTCKMGQLNCPGKGWHFGLSLWQRLTSSFLTSHQSTTQIVCTQDAKLCPDGSYVARSGPSCEFAPCPTPSADMTNWKTYTHKLFTFKYPSNFKFTE